MLELFTVQEHQGITFLKLPQYCYKKIFRMWLVPFYFAGKCSEDSTRNLTEYDCLFFMGFERLPFCTIATLWGGGVIILNLNEYLLLTVAFKVLWFWNKHIWWNIFYLYIEKITLDPKQCLDCVFNKLYCNNALFHLWKLCKNIFRQTTMVNFTYFHFSHFLALEMFHLHDIVTNWPYKLPYIVSFL